MARLLQRLYAQLGDKIWLDWPYKTGYTAKNYAEILPDDKDICQKIEFHFPVSVLPLEPLFEDEGSYIDLKSFSGYWKVVQRYLTPP